MMDEQMGYESTVEYLRRQRILMWAHFDHAYGKFLDSLAELKGSDVVTSEVRLHETRLYEVARELLTDIDFSDDWDGIIEQLRDVYECDEEFTGSMDKVNLLANMRRCSPTVGTKRKRGLF